HLDRAAVASPVALQDLDRRRLPRAVRAEQPEDLALPDLEADAAQRLVCAVGLAQFLDADRRHSSITCAPAGGKGGSSPDSSAAAIRPQSGWWPTMTTVSPRPSTASRTSSAVAPGASRSSGSGGPSPSASAV